MSDHLNSSLNDKNKVPDRQTKLSKWGNSQGIRLSKEDLNKAGILMEDTLDVYIQENKVTLEKKDKHQTLEEIFADYEGDYTPDEWDTGRSVGAEI